jgi:hypothetical protein
MIRDTDAGRICPPLLGELAKLALGRITKAECNEPSECAVRRWCFVWR